MAKKAYRVRNWSEYNKSLKQRGSLTVWINEKSLRHWYATHQKTKQGGRPKVYSDLAILTILTLKHLYHLDLRGCVGFVESLLELKKLSFLKVPSFSQLSRRQKHLKIPKFPNREEPIHLVIDSSGLKLFGEGEWKVRTHGHSKRRTWRKLHIGVDEQSQLIVTGELTGNDCGDDKRLPGLIEAYSGQLSQVSADGAYDSHACFDCIVAHGATPTIPIQPNPIHKPKRLMALKRPRDWVAWRTQQQGQSTWKKQSGYHRRSLVETAFYRYKQLFGDKLAARNFENQQTEALLKCHLLNQITSLGMPDSVASY